MDGQSKVNMMVRNWMPTIQLVVTWSIIMPAITIRRCIPFVGMTCWNTILKQRVRGEEATNPIFNYQTKCFQMVSLKLRCSSAHFVCVLTNLYHTGSPWYYDEIEGEITCFPTIDETPPPTNQLCGAALVLTSPVSKGDELLLDYCLQEPLPNWAKDWYTT